MTIVCYPKCSTCKKAVAWLSQRGIEPVYRDIQKENPTVEELKKWRRESGLPLKRFFNTSGQIYRREKLAERLPGMSEEEQYERLAKDGLLVKRPILLLDDGVLVGFKEKEWAEKIGT
ncbi:arsenate reductase family protein [Ruminococcaceae bacterium OttesenSCG-928-I18]|nr:arsenate reductase family protein [Ruminococcaceae bacterium OttesenSCG-928-I18]